MNLEDQVFHRLKPNFKKLEAYGFVKEKNSYLYSQKIMNNSFKAQISITNKGKILGEVIDLSFGGQYLNFRSYSGSKGGFANEVKNAYLQILQDIAENCFEIDPTIPVGIWLIPANPSYFDIDEAFKENKEIEYKQSSHIQVGDIVYIYEGSPQSSIRYRCRALKVNLPHHHPNPHVRINMTMLIQLERSFPVGMFSLNVMKKFGVKAVRGPRHMPQPMIDALKDKENY